MSNFYGLFPEDQVLYSKKWAYFEEAEPINIGGFEKCLLCEKPVSKLEWLPPFNINLSTKNAKRVGDLIWGTDFPFIISDRFKKIYEEEVLKGLMFGESPINITNVPIDIFPSELILHKVKIKWNGARRDDIRSGVFYDGSGCLLCYGGAILKKMAQIVILENSWNGDDFFQIAGLSGLVVITEKCRQVLEKCKIQNCFWVPIENIGYDEKAPLLWVINS